MTASRPRRRRAAFAAVVAILGAACVGCASEPSPGTQSPRSVPPASESDAAPDSAAAASNAPAFALEIGDRVWFHLLEHHVRSTSVGERPYLTDVHVSLAAELTARDEVGATYRVRFDRVWGEVDDHVSDEPLVFDTAVGVPDVFCRLDEVQGTIALAGREITMRRYLDGRSFPVPGSSVPPGLLVESVAAAAAVWGDDLRWDETPQVGRTWDTSGNRSLRALRLGLRMETQVTDVGADAAEFSQQGEASTIPLPAGALPPGTPPTKASIRTTYRVSSRDRLVLSSDSTYVTQMFLSANDPGMTHRVETHVERVGPPAP